MLVKSPLRDIRKLKKKGARKISSASHLKIQQRRMVSRLANAGVDVAVCRLLMKCRPGKCRLDGCSAACWFGDRGLVNNLILQAARLMQKTAKPLLFVTVIDPARSYDPGTLNSLASALFNRPCAADLRGQKTSSRVTSCLASLRWRWRKSRMDVSFGACTSTLSWQLGHRETRLRTPCDRPYGYPQKKAATPEVRSSWSSKR